MDGTTFENVCQVMTMEVLKNSSKVVHNPEIIQDWDKFRHLCSPL